MILHHIMVGLNCNWHIYVVGRRGIKTFTFPTTTHRTWHTAQSCNSWWRAPKQIRLAKKKEKSGHKNSLKVGWTSLSATSTICTGRHLIEFSSFQEENWLRSYFSHQGGRETRGGGAAGQVRSAWDAPGLICRTCLWSFGYHNLFYDHCILIREFW